MQNADGENRQRNILESELETMPNNENVATLRAKRLQARRASETQSARSQAIAVSEHQAPSTSTNEVNEDNVKMASLVDPGSDRQSSSEGVTADVGSVQLNITSS